MHAGWAPLQLLPTAMPAAASLPATPILELAPCPAAGARLQLPLLAHGAK